MHILSAKMNFLFSSKDEDSQLKAIDFGLSDFVKLGWSSKMEVEETTKMSLMTKGYFHNLLDMLLDTTHMCHFNCVYELPHQFEEYRLPRLGIGWARGVELPKSKRTQNGLLETALQATELVSRGESRRWWPMVLAGGRWLKSDGGGRWWCWQVDGGESWGGRRRDSVVVAGGWLDMDMC
ncbi:CDPK-related kinase 8, partial [Prunus dulcis]